MRTRWLAVALAAALAVPVAAAQIPAQAATCTIQLGGHCPDTNGYNDQEDLPPSNGFTTYLSDQPVGPQAGTTESLTADSPQSWTTTADAKPYGWTGVQTFPDVQQLTNNWGPGGWQSGSSDTPIAALSGLVVNYSAITPAGPNDIYELAPDVWTNYAGQLGQGSGDIMFWVYTSPTRCTENGLSSSDILGSTTLLGQDWTFYRYGPVGGEIVGILDTADHDPVTNGTCARQSSGSVDIKGGLDWLAANGFINTGPVVMGQLNTGFEITSSQNGVFGFTGYSWTTSPAPSPSPTQTSPSPSPTPTQTSPSPSPTPTQTSPSPSPSPTPTCRRHHRHCAPIRWFGTGLIPRLV